MQLEEYISETDVNAGNYSSSDPSITKRLFGASTGSSTSIAFAESGFFFALLSRSAFSAAIDQQPSE